jgi:hypothetical protein
MATDTNRPRLRVTFILKIGVQAVNTLVESTSAAFKDANWPVMKTGKSFVRRPPAM